MIFEEEDEAGRVMVIRDDSVVCEISITKLSLQVGRDFL